MTPGLCPCLDTLERIDVFGRWINARQMSIGCFMDE